MILYKQILVLFFFLSVTTYVAADSVLLVQVEAERKEVVLDVQSETDPQAVDQVPAIKQPEVPAELKIEPLEKGQESLAVNDKGIIASYEKDMAVSVEVATRSSKSLILYFVLLASILLCVVFIASIIPAKGVKP
jgi:hypothetical protein